MLDRELTTTEVVKLASEILKWELPVVITSEKLQIIKAIAGIAITQTHNQLKDPFKRLDRVVIKPKVSISDLAKLNRYTKYGPKK